MVKSDGTGLGHDAKSLTLRRDVLITRSPTSSEVKSAEQQRLSSTDTDPEETWRHWRSESERLGTRLARPKRTPRVAKVRVRSVAVPTDGVESRTDAWQERSTLSQSATITSSFRLTATYNAVR